MTAQATGTFTVSGWDENTYEELDGGGKLTKAHVTFGFDGDLKGEGGWEAVMCYGQDGTAAFTGFQRTAGELARPRGQLRGPGRRQFRGRAGADELAGSRGLGDR